MRLRFWPRHRDELIEESIEALAKQERLGGFIDLQRAEAAEVSAWARHRLEVNHLTELFLTSRRGAR